MIDHVIIFRADDLSEEASDELLEQLGRLSQVPGVLDFALGKNFGNRSRGFDYCMRITFADQASLEAYDADPLHQEVVKYNRAVTSEHLCVDFEWEPVTIPARQ
ncbi:MAG: stress responsive barrel domain protein [Mycobacterium sp.]|nr:stress responsive barrel domain protein [Mycobacterium sp.]